MNNAQATAALQPHATVKHEQFNARLVPTLRIQQFLGVKMGEIRAFAKSMGPEDAEEFLQCVPHPYVELNILHMLLVNTIAEPHRWREEMEAFLPQLDNWMVTDAAAPVLLTTKRLAPVGHSHVNAAAMKWCNDHRPYVARLGIILALLLMQRGYLTAELEQAVISAGAAHENYYVQMATAWFLATYFEREPEKVTGLLGSSYLSKPIRLKVIQKIIESRKTSDAVRLDMRALRQHIRAQG